MILNFSGWKKLNEQQAAAPVDLKPVKFENSSNYLSDGRVGYVINDDGSLSLHATNKKTNKAVGLRITPSELSLTTRAIPSEGGVATASAPIAVASYADAITKFLENATDVLAVGETGVKQWGAETAKLVNLLNSDNTLDETVKNKLVLTTKNNLFVLGGDPNAAAAKFFKAGVASILPSATFAKA